jgi:hypothetical protein
MLNAFLTFVEADFNKRDKKTFGFFCKAKNFFYLCTPLHHQGVDSNEKKLPSTERNIYRKVFISS